MWRTKENPGKAPGTRAFPGCLHLSSVVQLQSKLNLSRIERIVASGPNFSEVGVCVTARARSRYNSITAEVGRVKVRMVENVEELRPELHGEAFVQLECLEEREIEPVEARPRYQTRLAAQRGGVAERNAAGRSAWNRHGRPRYSHGVSRSFTQFTWLVECGRVPNPVRTVRAFHRLDLDSKIRALAWHPKQVTSKSRGRSGLASEVGRLTALKGSDPVCGPSSNHGVR